MILVNEFQANREVSKEFGRGATEVKLYVKIDGRKTQTRVLAHHNAIERMQAMGKVNQAKKIEYLCCESDADEWSDLFESDLT